MDEQSSKAPGAHGQRLSTANLLRSLTKFKPNTKMTSDVDKLLKKNEQLNQLDAAKVLSHVQRVTDEWVVNTLILEGYDVPFRYNRKKKFRDLTGTPVNLTFYRQTEQLAGMDFEVMKVVRIRKS